MIRPNSFAAVSLLPASVPVPLPGSGRPRTRAMPRRKPFSGQMNHRNRLPGRVHPVSVRRQPFFQVEHVSAGFRVVTSVTFTVFPKSQPFHFSPFFFSHSLFSRRIRRYLQKVNLQAGAVSRSRPFTKAGEELRVRLGEEETTSKADGVEFASSYMRGRRFPAKIVI